MIRRSVVIAVVLACVGPWSVARAQAPEARLEFKTGVGEKAQGFMRFMETIKKMAGLVKDVSGGAAKGMDGGLAGALVTVALNTLLLKGIADPNLRGIISSALGEAAKQFTKKGFKLTDGVIAVLRYLAKDPRLGKLIAGGIPLVELRPMVEKGVTAVFSSLANASGVKRLMGNPMGFLTEVGLKLIDDIKAPLADVLVNLVKPDPRSRAALKAELVAALVALKKAISAKSFSELLTFGKMLATLFVKGFYDQFVNLLRNNVPTAKQKLGELADKLKKLVPALANEVTALVGPILASLNAGAGKFVAAAGRCREMITGLDQQSAKGLFLCLKAAVGGASGGSAGQSTDAQGGGGEAPADCACAAKPAASADEQVAEDLEAESQDSPKEEQEE